MTVWIVIQNRTMYPECIEVFNNEAAAKHHAKMLNKKWNLVDIIEKEVKAL